MATATDLDTDVLEGLDSDWEIACEIPERQKLSPGGWPACQGDPAQWIAKMICDCKTPGKPACTLLCDFCKKTYEDWASVGASLSCIWCGKGGKLPPVNWFTPLKA